MGQYGTREDEVDDLLRGRSSSISTASCARRLRVVSASYSIKKVERLLHETRKAEVARTPAPRSSPSRSGSTRGEPTILESIERYNEEDCVSTLLLRDWLLERARRRRRHSATDRAGARAAARPRGSRRRVTRSCSSMAARRGSSRRSGDGATTASARCWRSCSTTTGARRARWWAFFDRAADAPRGAALRLRGDRRARLRPGPAARAATRDRSSTGVTFPAQEHKLGPATRCSIPRRRRAPVTWSSLELDGGCRLKLRRGRWRKTTCRAR